jgi:hypothetical protein
MVPEELLASAESDVVPRGDETTSESASLTEQAAPAQRSKVRVLQYSRSDLLI